MGRTVPSDDQLLVRIYAIQQPIEAAWYGGVGKRQVGQRLNVIHHWPGGHA